MSDDLDNDFYYNPSLQDEPVDVPPEDTTLAPMDRGKLVRRIASDSAEHFDVRHSAKRLLELAEVRPASYFNERYAELMELRAAYQRENAHERI